VPLAQSAVADLVPVEGRAKFLGRIQVGGEEGGKRSLTGRGEEGLPCTG
jgi:hypothetical protein